MKKEQRKLAGIEIPITAITNKYTFPNNNFLNGKTVTGIWIPDNSEGNLYAPSGATVVGNDAIFASTFTIRHDSDSIVLDIPLTYFLESWYGGDRTMRQLWVEGFTPGTTFIQVQDTDTINLGESFFLMVEYIDC